LAEWRGSGNRVFGTLQLLGKRVLARIAENARM
jgi:hypothetical protein